MYIATDSNFENSSAKIRQDDILFTTSNKAKTLIRYEINANEPLSSLLLLIGRKKTLS